MRLLLVLINEAAARGNETIIDCLMLPDPQTRSIVSSSGSYFMGDFIFS